MSMGITEFKLDLSLIDEMVLRAINEDVGSGDLSTDLLIPKESTVRAKIVAKDYGVVAGLLVAEKVFKQLDPELNWKPRRKDGAQIKRGEIIVEFEGSYRAILTGERSALNFLQRMSGIATRTSKFVNAVKDYKTEILDTRKTLPGFRMLDKYSVQVGGGTNHRIGLYDMVMLKENHIRVAGGIIPAVQQVRKGLAEGIKVEVETTTLDEVKQALDALADIIMLDNMSNEEMLEAVKLIAGKAKVEASGSVTLARAKTIAALGVDYISVGALTHSVEALDLSQQIIV